MNALRYRANPTQDFPVTPPVKNPPPMRETWVRSLGWEDPLEKGKATHSSIPAWRIPWTIQSMGPQRAAHDWATFTSLFPQPTKLLLMWDSVSLWTNLLADSVPFSHCAPHQFSYSSLMLCFFLLKSLTFACSIFKYWYCPLLRLPF